MRDPSYIIKKPLVTEKATWEASHIIKQGKRQGQALNRYTFHVAISAGVSGVVTPVLTISPCGNDSMASISSRQLRNHSWPGDGSPVGSCVLSSTRRAK